MSKPKVAVVHPPPVTQPPPEYHVVLTELEAQIVCALLGRSTGNDGYELFQALNDALRGKPRSYSDFFEAPVPSLRMKVST